jgi:ribonuclease D
MNPRPLAVRPSEHRAGSAVVEGRAGMREQLLVADDSGLSRVADAVAGEPRIALDTESNGFHAYTEQVCLVQIATPAADYAIDVLAVPLGPLLPLLADPAREIVLHAAEYDVVCLKREWGVTLGRIFDTHAAAKVLGIERVGLGNLLQDELGLLLTEDEQRSDWGRRPLTKGQLSYAFADVQHLLTLRERLGARLAERGLGSEAEAEFARLVAKEARPRQFDVDGWQKMKAARTLDGQGRGVLREMYLLRDRRAREINRPPFKVLSDLLLAEVARRQPRTEDEVLRVPGAQSTVLRRLAAEILEAVRAGQSGAPPPRPRSERGPPWRRGAPEPEVEERYEKLRAWRKGRAEARKVEVQVIAPNAVLMAVARTAPRTLEDLGRVDGMDPFRVQQYGEEILTALHSTPQQQLL